MAKTYEEYESEQLERSKTLAEQSVSASNSLYDTAIADAETEYTASAKETESSYRQLYDANAVDELVARRDIEETLANMGLTDSGLNRTQQTAISLSRSRADSQVSRQKQEAVNAIMRELDSLRAQYTAQKTAASRDIYAQADADILSFKTTADSAARQNAASLYASDREAETAQSTMGA